MITIQDSYIGITKIEHRLAHINYDKRTTVCASDIAQYFDEYYPELFEDIASNLEAYASFNFRIETMYHYSFAEIAADYLADNGDMNGYDFANTLAQEHGYETLDEMERDYIVFIDSALDGAVVIG